MKNVRASRVLALVASGFLLVACATEVDDVVVTPSVGTTPAAKGGVGTPSTQQRYIVSFNDPRAQQAVEAVGGHVALDIPALNAFAAYIPEAAVQGLLHNPHIADIEVDEIRYASAEPAQVVPYGITKVQAPLLWAGAAASGSKKALPPTTGAGKKICIIDSGIDLSHPDFAGVNVTGQDTPGTGQWNKDDCGHGTHVAGTIAAANNAIGVVGVAPGAELHIVKVFSGTACNWTYSSGLLSAVSLCRSAGANIISMSLGGGAKSRFEDAEFQRAANAGILSIAAAGNGGNSTISYPAGYASVMSVAAVDSNNAKASFSQYNSDVEIAGPGVAVLSTVPIGHGPPVATTTVAGDTIPSIAMGDAPVGTGSGPLVDCGLGAAVCAGATGKVCLIARGDITFETKITNCSAGGGVAAIIYNNVAGDLTGVTAGTTTTIPSVGITQADGLLLQGRVGQAATVSISRGNYDAWDGTSMATPHVSGVAAAVWSAAPTRPAAEIRDALDKSALDLGSPGRDTSFGYGLVQGQAALDRIINPPAPTCGGSGSTCSSNAQCCSNACVKQGKGYKCL